MKRTVFVMLAVLLSTASARVWYVHPDSTRNRIQPCLDACGAGDTVLVGSGTYHENINWPNIQGIRLRSESGQDSTVIHGDSTGTVITVGVSVDTTTAIEGFTISGGCSAGEGGGMWVTNSGPMVRGNVFTGNDGGSGGGLGAVTADSLYVVDNRFIRNLGNWGGALSVAGGVAFVKGNSFLQNRTDTTGTFYLEDAGGLVEANVFRGNLAEYYGGLWCVGGVTAAIRGNVFEDETTNVFSGAGGFVYGASPEYSGNAIRRCRAPYCGAVLCYQASPVIVGDTFVENVTSSSWANGSIVCMVGASPRFSRSVVARNTAPRFIGAITVYDSSAPVIDSCSIENNDVAGVYVMYGADATISHCNISGNFLYGLYCEDSDDSIDARNNWWGHSTGPFHPDSNPGGLGDTVSSGARFRPWLRDSVLMGMAELGAHAPVAPPMRATIVRGVLMLAGAGSRQHSAYRAELLDAAGRRVMELAPGPNDVRHLAPGVYFVCSEPSAVSRRPSAVRKVTVTR